MNQDKPRCAWVPADPLYIDYHDKEWGVPIHDERLLFEFLILEGAQAGLSWITILKRRDNYRKAFKNFDADKIAKYTDQNVKELLENAGIIRNRLKIQATITNAKAYQEVKKEFGTFTNYIWHFVNNTPIKNHWKTQKEVPARTPLSDAMAKDLKKRGFKFVGTTICYAYMQAVGIVNDHIKSCFRYKEI